MSPDEKRIVLEPQPERRPASLGALLAAGMALVVAMGLLGSVGSPVEAPSDSLPEVTAPRQQPLAIMPQVTGKYLIEVVDLLRDSGLDSTVVSRARWVANAQVGSGVVSSQTPEPGSDVFDINEVDLVISAGGPVISWDDVPMDLQDLVATNYTPDRTEPILIVETSAGRVYKTDSLLFGTCDGVALVRDTFFDRSFDGLCHQSPPATIVGWTPNGAMYAIEGLPRQGERRTDFAVQLDSHSWGVSSIATDLRRAPTITIQEDGIRIVGGYDEFFLPTDGVAISATRLAEHIEPVDIRGNLVLNLLEPMTFSPLGPGVDFPTETVNFDNVGVSTTATETVVDTSPGYADAARITTVQATRWSVISVGDWQYAVPSGWIAGDPTLSTSTATFDDPSPDIWCKSYPVGSLGEVGPDDAFVAIYPGQATDFNLWLQHFDPDDVPPVSGLDPDLHCLKDIAAEVRTSSRFYDGVSFDIVIGFGSQVDEETRKQAFAILDSFEPNPVYERP